VRCDENGILNEHNRTGKKLGLGKRFGFLAFKGLLMFFFQKKCFRAKVLVYEEGRTQNYDPGRTRHTTILPVTSFSTNYNKIHKSRLKYEIKYNLHKIAQKIF